MRGQAHDPGTQVDVQAARRWLQARGVGDACPVCRGTDMKVSKDFFVALGIQAQNGAPDLGSGSPMVRLRCASCGHILFFHARQMGLI